MCAGADLAFGANIYTYLDSDSGMHSSWSKFPKLPQIIKITLTFKLLMPSLRERYTGI